MIVRRTSTPHPIAEAVEWYRQNQPLYCKLSRLVAGLIEEALEAENIPCHSVQWRAKSVESYEKKALMRGFLQPRRQISDMSGVRVITFVQSDAEKACRVIEKLFKVLETEDKTGRNDTNGFGYRSVHYLARLNGDQGKELAERELRGLPFEIQVRTLLQHAWAEIEHDRNYKFEGQLVPDLQRRFAMLAAVLELADREFNTLAASIDDYVASIRAQTDRGNLDIPINTTSLREFLLGRFSDLTPLPLNPHFATRRDAEEIVTELIGMGIDTLAKLDEIIPKDFLEKAKRHLELSTLAAIARDILIIHNADKFFRVTRHEHSQPIGSDSLALYEAYGLDPELVMHKDAAVTPEAFWRDIREAR